MHRAKPADPRYFGLALQLLRRLHERDVVHNDLAKEPNWLVTPDGRPALVDFQLASWRKRRGKLFRMMAHDDLRHLLKHKRSYVLERLIRASVAFFADRTAKAGDRLHDPRQTR